MTITIKEQEAAAKEFAKFWDGKGYEKGETQQFWTSLLQDVYGVEDPKSFIQFEAQVDLGHKSFIDAYIPETKILIEQKGSHVDLTKKQKQSDGQMLTPFEQGRRYANNLPHSQRPRWIVVSNFKEFHLYDTEKMNKDPYVIKLSRLPELFHEMNFLVDKGQERIIHEEKLSIKAGELVGKIYDALRKQYKDPDSDASQRSLNRLCVQLVFCLYAEDSKGLFPKALMFHNYLSGFKPNQMRQALKNLFSVLNTPIEERDEYLADDNPLLAEFPYVNGGLFADSEFSEIPPINQDIADAILIDASEGFDWSEISPTIFGAVFESTLNPETRHDGGMHYTSIENIHKVIDPLFMGDLIDEFRQIKELSQRATKKKKLLAFQEKLAGLKFLDPACGSGNFLTESFLSLRNLENQVVDEYLEGQGVLGLDEFDPIKIGIHQFYGIEINDFATTVAMTALWIAEAQMHKKTEAIIKRQIDFFPLKSNTNIHEANALTLDWKTVVDPSELSFIMGNPPFLGYTQQSKEQKNDLEKAFATCTSTKFNKKVDYVTGWFYKASNFIKGHGIKCAFVATNSITQGEQPTLLWKPLIQENNIEIDFGWRSFQWDSEASDLAHVHCVIIGFSEKEEKQKSSKELFLETGTLTSTSNINQYLLAASNIFVESRTTPLSNVPLMQKGSQPTDGGNLLISAEEYKSLVEAKQDDVLKFVRPFLGAQEYLHNQPRYCLWLKNASPSVMKKNRFIFERIEATKAMRLASKKEATRKAASTPWLFDEIRQPEEGNYLLVPSHTKGGRNYVPIGFLPYTTIASNAALFISNATLYHFGVMESSVHMAWMRIVCGRLETRYRYSASVVYNNFIWPQCSDKQKAKIEETAQKILDARKAHPDDSLADLYDPLVMPIDLRKAHQANDKAVMDAYGFDKNMTEAEIVAKLMTMYETRVKALELEEVAEKAVRKVIGKKAEIIPDWLEALRGECLKQKITAEELVTQGKARLKEEKKKAKK